MEKLKVAVIGAGGKTGTRISNNLARRPDLFDLKLVENSPAGVESIRARGLDVTLVEETFAEAEVIVLAVPDTLIRKLSEVYVPMMRPEAGLLTLDPVVAVTKGLILRGSCTFGVAHPCHPSYFLDQDTYEARQDRFGGCGGKRDIMMSKIQGDDVRFTQLVEVAKSMYAPVLHAYVMISEQIAFLGPTLVELLGATCLYVTAETVDKVEEKGIERGMAIFSLTGHIYNLTTNLLGLLPGKPPVSDAYKVAIGLGGRLVLRDGWKEIQDGEVLDRVIATMPHSENPRI